MRGGGVVFILKISLSPGGASYYLVSVPRRPWGLHVQFRVKGASGVIGILTQDAPQMFYAEKRRRRQ